VYLCAEGECLCYALEPKSTVFCWSLHAYVSILAQDIYTQRSAHIHKNTHKSVIKKMERIRIHLFISKEILEDFRKLIMWKYERYEKGLLSYEAEMALRAWLAEHTKAQKSIDQRKKANPTPRVIIAFAEVKDYLLRKYYDELLPGQQIPRRHLEEAIINTRGSDPRTIHKWLRVFERMGLVKCVTSASWKIM